MEWRKVPGWPCYSVSDLGDVRRDKSGRILAGGKDKDGYRQVILSYKGKRKGIKVHRLIALTFIPNPDNKPMINHIDGNKTNNNVSNLEWVTNQENQDHFWRVIDSEEHHRKRVETHKGKGLLSDNPNAKAVVCIELNKTFSTLIEAEKATGVKYTKISSACHHHQKTAGGYHWEFMEVKNATICKC